MVIGQRVIDAQPPMRIIIAMRSDGLRERLCKSMRAKDFKCRTMEVCEQWSEPQRVEEQLSPVLR
jgi:hypothetical protein